MKKADIFLVLVILLAAVGLGISFFGDAEEGAFVRVTVDGAEQKRVPFDEDVTFIVETDQGKNEVELTDGRVSMKSADCPDQICVAHKKIRYTGETIVCLPHKLVIEVVGTEAQEIDGVVG